MNISSRTAVCFWVCFGGLLLALATVTLLALLSVRTESHGPPGRKTLALLGDLGGEIESMMDLRGVAAFSACYRQFGEECRRANLTNVNIEAVVLVLGSVRSNEVEIEHEPYLGNTDNDRVAAPGGLSTELLEYVDEWGNPLAFFFCEEYAERIASGERIACKSGRVITAIPVRWRSGEFHHPSSFQIISAGSDGLFGTVDDLLLY